MRPVALSAALLGLTLWGQAPPPLPTHSGARAAALPATLPSSVLINEIKARQQAVANVEYLSDFIGGRLTGSDQLVKAHDWAEAKMRSYGLSVLPREAYDFGKPWTRGPARARLLTHNRVPLAVEQMAWTPATPGLIRGEVLSMGGDIDQMVALIGQFKGKILLLAGRPERPKGDPAEFQAKYQRVQAALKEEGIGALLLSFGGKEGLFSMTGSPEPSRRFPHAPAAFLTPESMKLLTRLLKRKEKVELELELGGVTGASPVQAFNSLAELRGTEKPEEIVLLGAHLDSWDLASGATDNGTGVAAVMEALRAIKASGLQPRRTIRVALFSGEEQGLYGAEAYVKAHGPELPRHQAVLIHDGGSGRVRGWSLQGREDLLPFMAQALATQNDLGIRELPLESNNDTDHAPFLPFGVPAFSAVQDDEGYMQVTHHTQVDTFDHVNQEGLLQGAQALAITAWELATMPERLPHRAPAPKSSPSSNPH
jgi:hypothetical protein